MGKAKWESIKQNQYSANINPLGLSLSVKNTILSHLNSIIHYPDPECRGLRAAISAFYSLETSFILPGNGAAELLYLLMEVLRPKRVLIPAPSFSEYARAAVSVHADVVYWPLQVEAGLQPDLGVLAAEACHFDCLFLANPNNPTGNLLPRREIIQLLESLQHTDTYVVIDESFIDFRSDGGEYSVADLVRSYPRLIVLHSLTKIFALPGLRLGFAAAAPELVAAAEAHTDVWHVNVLAQAAGVAALQDTEYLARTQSFVQAEGNYLYGELQKLPDLRVWPPSVNFILGQSIRQDLPAHVLRQHLQNKGILLRDCGNYPGLTPYFFRLAVRTRRENERLIHDLRACLTAKSTEKTL